MRKLLFAALMFLSGSALAGTKLLAPTNAPHSDTLPATCSQGDIYQLTSAGTGTQWYACESANTWVQQGGSGGGNFIKNQSTLQSGATFYVSSGTVTELQGQDINLFNTATGFSGTTNSFSMLTSNNAFAPYGEYLSLTGINPLLLQHTNSSTLQTLSLSIDATQHQMDVADNDGSTINHLFIASRSALKTGTELRIYSNFNFGGHFTALASTNTTSDTRFYLPTADGSNGDSLITDGSGHLSFSTISGSGSGPFTQAKSSTTIEMGSHDINSVVNINGTGTFYTTNNVVADNIMGSNAGKFNIAGTTVTLPAPATDSNDRMLVLNGGVGTFPLIVTDGARLGQKNTFTDFDSFTSTNGASVTYGLSVGSETITGLNANSLLYVDGSTQVATVTIGSNLTFSGGTLSATGGSGSSPFTQAVSTTNLSMGGKNLTNLGAEGWSVQPSSWVFMNQTGGQVMTNGSTVTLSGMSCTVQPASTYTFVAFIRYKSNGSGAGGIKYQFTGPTNAAIQATAAGPNNGATTYRADQGMSAFSSDMVTAISNYNSATTNQQIITGVFNTDATNGGTFAINGVSQTTGVATVEWGTWMVVTRVSP